MHVSLSDGGGAVLDTSYKQIFTLLYVVVVSLLCFLCLYALMQARDRNSDQCPRSLFPSPCVAGYCESIDMVLRRFSLGRSVSETALL